MSGSPTKLLVTVMTYPHPSEGYQELVCTAGITEHLKWIRLYPYPRRYAPKDKQFQKYQWIEVELEERTRNKDDRKESRRPIIDSLRIIGIPLSVANGWSARREIIDAMPHHTIEELEAQYKTDNTSLGIVRPERILDMVIEKDDPEWKPKWRAVFKQPRLFGYPQLPLHKIPYKFRYVFTCQGSDRQYIRMCEDWELGVLFLKERERLGSDSEAADSVRRKFLGELCNPKIDTRFFVGTIYPHNTWIVLGVFWPPKTISSSQGVLF